MGLAIAELVLWYNIYVKSLRHTVGQKDATHPTLAVRILKVFQEILPFIQFLQDHEVENAGDLLNNVIPDLKNKISYTQNNIIQKK